MLSNGARDHTEQLLVRIGGADGHPVQKLDHETREALKGSRNSDRGRNLDQDAFGGVDVDLKLACLVDGRIEEGQ